MSHTQFSRIAVIISLCAVLLVNGLVLAQDATPESTPEPAAAQTTITAASPAVSAGLITALRHTHSLVRWLVVMITIVAIGRLGMGVAQSLPYDTLTQRIMRFFSLATTLQWVIGVVFVIAYATYLNGTIPGYVWGHLAVMTIALAVSHMHNMFKKRPDNVRYRNSLVLVIVVLVLVIIGVALLPQGWRIVPTA